MPGQDQRTKHHIPPLAVTLVTGLAGFFFYGGSPSSLFVIYTGRPAVLIPAYRLTIQLTIEITEGIQNMARTLSDIEKSKIREYIDAKKLHSTPREKLAAMILADLGIEVSGVSAARIRREAFEDQDTANSRKEAGIREKVLEHVEVEAPKALGYIQDEIDALRSMAYGDKAKGLEPEEMTVTERVRVSGAILASCKTLIEIIGPPKPDRHITTTLEILETADVSEFMKYGDKDGPDTSEMADPSGDQAP